MGAITRRWYPPVLEVVHHVNFPLILSVVQVAKNVQFPSLRLVTDRRLMFAPWDAGLAVDPFCGCEADAACRRRPVAFHPAKDVATWAACHRGLGFDDPAAAGRADAVPHEQSSDLATSDRSRLQRCCDRWNRSSACGHRASGATHEHESLWSRLGLVA